MASSTEMRSGVSDGCSMRNAIRPGAVLGALKVKPEPAGRPSASSCCESRTALGAEGSLSFFCGVADAFCARAGAAHRSATSGSVTKTLWTRPGRELGRNSFTVSIRVSRTARRCEKLPGRVGFSAEISSCGLAGSISGQRPTVAPLPAVCAPLRASTRSSRRPPAARWCGR